MLPKTMKAIEITAAGAPDVLRYTSLPAPQPASHEILIRVHAAGVNRPDVAQRQGSYPPPPGASPLPGLEIAGEVVACGKEAKAYAAGAKVMALIAGGGYAEYAVVDERNALPIPAGMDDIHAAAVPETFFTVWDNVFRRGGLKKGETLLVHGGSSGIGTTAIQLAKAFGAAVIITAGSAEKCQACEKLGADLAVNYREQDFVEAVNSFTRGKGVDVILDMVGGDYTEKNYKAAAVEGRIVQIAFLHGHKPAINLNLLMQKRLCHTGSTLRARDVAFKAEIAADLRAKVWPFLEQGTVKPLIDTVLPLEQAAKAHERMEKSNHIGKIVLKV
ncbi:MAG: NAD(P)H quinone oxidoreductase, PIG3 family [Candidatus Tokpelaia hoelldobleri]|uniref:NAD(P)H quinone oxidoreductase, PIG3 family n=1 Tax=Candidatus Tokpelaia hoelldobleri TaxID=1902579 RepID=A0A1U9JWX9_9HYPH|nr:MAG: NAD(P)H quinone oxidoreductase, PIG3 family [Candidatus Tokpelaia hoelldoblerii]